MSVSDSVFINPRPGRGQRVIVVCWSVCLSVIRLFSPGCHSTAFTAWMPPHNKLVIVFDVTASLSNKSQEA